MKELMKEILLENFLIGNQEQREEFLSSDKVDKLIGELSMMLVVANNKAMNGNIRHGEVMINMDNLKKAMSEAYGRFIAANQISPIGGEISLGEIDNV